MRCFKKRERSQSRQDANALPFNYLMRVPDLPSLKCRYVDYHKKYFIHHTAGWRNQSATSFFKNFLKRRLCADFMEEDGQIFVQRNWEKSGSHLGAGIYPDGKKAHSRHGAGLEIACGGVLEKKSDGYYTWFGKKIDNPNLHTDGRYYEPMTQAQIGSLARYLKDLKNKYPEIEFYSHDEVSGYRGKTDIGGSIGMPFREFLKERVYK